MRGIGGRPEVADGVDVSAGERRFAVVANDRRVLSTLAVDQDLSRQIGFDAPAPPCLSMADLESKAERSRSGKSPRPSPLPKGSCLSEAALGRVEAEFRKGLRASARGYWGFARLGVTSGLCPGVALLQRLLHAAGIFRFIVSWLLAIFARSC